MSGRYRRRGVISILVLGVFAITAGLLVLMTLDAGRHLRDRQTDRVHLAATAMADSAAAYVQEHIKKRTTTQPAEDIILDMTGVAFPGGTGEARLTFVELNGHMACRVSVRATLGTYVTTETRDIQLHN